MQIPIQNIYYLLCYAWNRLDEKERVSVSVEELNSLLDLMARVLINATRIILKRGIDLNYTVIQEELAGIKGKLAVSETLKTNILDKQRTLCQYDEFTPNILQNQILYSTLKKLVRIRKLDKDLKEEIRYLLVMFPPVDLVEIRSPLFQRIKYHRNNLFYGFLMDICEIINENCLPSEVAGEWKFMDFTRDEIKMYRLFENFVYNYYKLKHPEYKVKREQIDWRFGVSNPEHLNFVPRMLTDITLQDKNQKIIIDTKYYQETLAQRYEVKKVKSANLYQLFSYLLNQEDGSSKTQNAVGILLYPRIEEGHDLEFTFESHKIFIKTIDLNTNWMNIEKRLDEMIYI